MSSILSTEQLVNLLSSLDLKASGILNSQRVNFDPPEFFRLLSDSQFEITKSNDGIVSIVEETEDAMDFSRQTGRFDLHTDGLYRSSPPDFVILFCCDPGMKATPSIFVDTRVVINKLKDEGLFETINGLELVYIDKEGRSYPQPLITHHPRTCESVIKIGSRAFIRPKLGTDNLISAPTLRDMTFSISNLFRLLDDSLVLRHQWSAGDLIFFDNYSYVHGREADQCDPNRSLMRLWLSVKKSC